MVMMVVMMTPPPMTPMTAVPIPVLHLLDLPTLGGRLGRNDVRPRGRGRLENGDSIWNRLDQIGIRTYLPHGIDRWRSNSRGLRRRDREHTRNSKQANQIFVHASLQLKYAFAPRTAKNHPGTVCNETPVIRDCSPGRSHRTCPKSDFHKRMPVGQARIAPARFRHGRPGLVTRRWC